jgi:hypothetical protein
VEWPQAGEFYTDEAISRAAPHTRVLLSLTEKDIKEYAAARTKVDGKDVKESDMYYPLLALSRGLLDRKEQRAYGVKHFSEIVHPVIKLSWAIMLFNDKAASPEVVRFVRSALESKEQSKVIAEMVGPDFEDFKRRVTNHPLKEK